MANKIQTNFHNAVFIDIETVPEHKSLPDRLRPFYMKRFQKDVEAGKYATIEEHYANEAGKYAEFGKVISVAIGRIQKIKKDDGMVDVMYIKTITGRHENEVLVRLSEALDKVNETDWLVAHNGKSFDFPFLFRRYIINKLDVPWMLIMFDKKPYNLRLRDTMEMWSHTEWKHMVGLDLLATLLGLPSPKKDMTGGQVAEVFYSMFDDLPATDLPFAREKEVLDRIATYNASDIVTLCNIYLHLICVYNFRIESDEQIIYIS